MKAEGKSARFVPKAEKDRNGADELRGGSERIDRMGVRANEIEQFCGEGTKRSCGRRSCADMV